MSSEDTVNKERIRPLVIAHRGAASRRPENTIAAFEAAIAIGADGIECDARLSADGVPVVLHDATLDRTTNGKGLVAEHSLQQLRRLDAGAGQRIPTLAEVAETCRKKAILTVEFKTVETVAPSIKVLANANPDSLVFCSFNTYALLACAELHPKVRRLLIIGSLSFNPLRRWREAFPLKTMLRTRVQGLSCHHSMLSPNRALRLRKKGFGIVLWSTIPEEEEEPRWYDKALQRHPDALVTIWPDILLNHPSLTNSLQHKPRRTTDNR